MHLEALAQVVPRVSQTGALSAIAALNISGYTPNHQQYAAQRARMVSNSMHGANLLRETLDIKFVIAFHETGQMKGKMWGVRSNAPNCEV